MKNTVEYYINYNKNLCSPLQEEQLQSSPSINPSDLNPLITYLALNNYLSEFETELEKRRAMLNLLLIDPIPKEDSTNLVNSGTIFKIMREGKLERDQLTELFNSLQRRKADKSELFSKKYSDLTGVPKKLSNFENDLNLISQTYLLELLLNYYNKSEIQEYIQHNQGEIDPQQVSEVVTQLVIEKLSRLAQVAFSGDYDDLTSKPDIPTKVSDLENDSLYVTSSEVSSSINTAVSNFIPETNIKTINGESILGKGNIGFKQVVLTQNQYDSLTEYDNNTLYFIRDNSSKTFGSKFPIKF